MKCGSFAGRRARDPQERQRPLKGAWGAGWYIRPIQMCYSLSSTPATGTGSGHATSASTSSTRRTSYARPPRVAMRDDLLDFTEVLLPTVTFRWASRFPALHIPSRKHLRSRVFPTLCQAVHRASRHQLPSMPSQHRLGGRAGPALFRARTQVHLIWTPRTPIQQHLRGLVSKAFLWASHQALCTLVPQHLRGLVNRVSLRAHRLRALHTSSHQRLRGPVHRACRHHFQWPGRRALCKPSQPPAGLKLRALKTQLPASFCPFHQKWLRAKARAKLRRELVLSTNVADSNVKCMSRLLRSQIRTKADPSRVTRCL